MSFRRKYKIKIKDLIKIDFILFHNLLFKKRFVNKTIWKYIKFTFGIEHNIFKSLKYYYIYNDLKVFKKSFINLSYFKLKTIFDSWEKGIFSKNLFMKK